MRIKITIEDQVQCSINGCVEDKRIAKSDPEWPVYVALYNRMRALRSRSITLFTEAEIRVVFDELVSRVDCCNEILGYEDDAAETQLYLLERGRCQRSADRLEPFLAATEKV